jgi:hypothetical protein
MAQCLRRLRPEFPRFFVVFAQVGTRTKRAVTNARDDHDLERGVIAKLKPSFLQRFAQAAAHCVHAFGAVHARNQNAVFALLDQDRSGGRLLL